MKHFLLLLLVVIACPDLLFAQDVKRGTIKIKKPGQITYIISKASSVALPQVRVFRRRFYNYSFKEYFPKEYKSQLFPLVFNFAGLYMADAMEQQTDNRIVSYDYELFKSQVMYKRGTANAYTLTVPLRELSYMMTGSCLWIKNLSYKDKDGVLHEGETGEFKIEKVK